MGEIISEELSKGLYIQRAKKFRTKKRLGQNFLIEPDIIEKIISNVKEDDVVLEIGPGAGFVTEQLVKIAKKVIAVELDEDAIKVLESNLGKYENFTLIHNDILKINLSDIFKEEFKKGEKIKVVANIPYYITSPIIVHLLGEINDAENGNRSMINEIILMVQYEVAKRIVADNNSQNKEYGMLSILSQFWADCSIVKNVSKKCFYPSPKVDSAIVRIKIKNKPACEITPLLRRTIKAAFLSRRKNIKNSLLNSGFLNVEHALEKCEIDFQTRGEKLSINDFCRLSKALEEVQNKNNMEEFIKPVFIEIDFMPDFRNTGELKNLILENLQLIGDLKIKSNGKKVCFSKTAIKSSFEENQVDNIKCNCLKELIENAIFDKSKKIDKKQRKNSGQELYYNAFIYNNKIYGVQIYIDTSKSLALSDLCRCCDIKIMEIVNTEDKNISSEQILTKLNIANINVANIKKLFSPV